METSSWTDPAVVVQIGAGFVAIVAAVVVIVQAIYTRRALEEAGRSRRVAEQALAVAQAEHQNSTFLSTEAIRARISVSAPSAELHVEAVDDRLFSPSISGSGYPEAWPAGYVFHVREAERILMVRAEVTLRNTGLKPTRFVLNRALRTAVTRTDEHGVPILIGTEPGPEDVLLEPGEQFAGYFEVSRPLREWIEVFDTRAAGDSGPETALEAYVDDGLDTGATYVFAVVLSGAAVIPERPGLRETWVFAGLYDPRTGRDTGIGTGTRQVVARAWLSKTKGIELPDEPPSVGKL